jgi:phage terminase large subunit GpA-like protein
MKPARKVVTEAARAWAPPPKLTLSEWADAYRFLSSESGAAAGKWKTLPFQREILDSFTAPDVHTVVVMSATQLVKTVLIENALGYIIDRDPAPTLLVTPRDSDADRFSKIRLAPMIRDTPCLRAKVLDVKTRRATDILSYKQFAGGFLAISAAGSPGNLAALPIRFLFADEIDKFPCSAGGEGDPVSLARKRQATYWNRKTVMCCSPTTDPSRIQKAFEDSDQREYYVPCPQCGECQALKWPNVRWDNGLATKEARAASAYYECEKCQARWNDVERWRAVENGHWQASAPFAGTAGFHISELASPWKKLSEIVLDFLVKKDDPAMLQTFVNTSLAETWKQKGEQPEWATIYLRREDYGERGVPAPVLLLVAAVDVMEQRLEVELVGYSRTRESWSIAYETIPGSPTDMSADGPWAGVEALLMADYPHELGGRIPVAAMAIDTGEKPQPVYAFAARHARPVWSPARGGRVTVPRCVIPIKGTDDAFRLISNVSAADAARKRGDVRIYSIGTHYAKQELYDLLRLTPLEGGGFPPWYCHFPLSYEREYFRGLCSEKRVVRASGKVEWIHDSAIPNEPLDLRVYCRAAAELCGLTQAPDQVWDAWQELVSQPAEG